MKKNALYRAVLKETLNLKGYKVQEATTGYEGILLAKKCSPDLILSASNFSDGSCWDVYERLNKDHVMSNIPFICLSSRPLIDEEKGGHEMVTVLKKPLANEVLFNNIQNHIIKV